VDRIILTSRIIHTNGKTLGCTIKEGAFSHMIGLNLFKGLGGFQLLLHDRRKSLLNKGRRGRNRIIFKMKTLLGFRGWRPLTRGMRRVALSLNIIININICCWGLIH